MAHASTDARIPAVARLPADHPEEPAPPERHVRQLHDATEQPVVADLQADRELLTDPPHFASGRRARVRRPCGRTPPTLKHQTSAVPDTAARRNTSIEGASHAMSCTALPTTRASTSSTSGTALAGRHYAGDPAGAQHLGMSTAMPAVDPAAVE